MYWLFRCLYQIVMSLYDETSVRASLCILSIVFYPCAVSYAIEILLFCFTLTIVHGCLAHLLAHYSIVLVRESWAVVTFGIRALVNRF